MRITVLYNDDRRLSHGSAEDRLAVEGVLECAAAIAAACARAGHEVTQLAASPEPRTLLDDLATARPELVVNLVESVNGEARLEAAVAWLLELCGLPYTGSPPTAMTLGLNKPVAKAVLAAHGVPVARGVLLEDGDGTLPDLPFPWIVKPSREDASHGITTESIVHDAAAARARARYVISTYAQPALVEQFLPGREFNVAMVGDGEVLSPSEIDFGGLPQGHPPLVTYEAKWAPESVVYQGTPSVAAELSPELEARLVRIAKAAYSAIGLRDYGRVDMRLDASGAPVVLEVNPNPDISPDAGFSRAAARSGLTHDDLIARIVDAAARRAAPARPR